MNRLLLKQAHLCTRKVLIEVELARKSGMTVTFVATCSCQFKAVNAYLSISVLGNPFCQLIREMQLWIIL